MSASLVGSEMCIRDSWAGSHPARRPSPRGGPSTRRSWRIAAYGGSAGSCLLYTSDAADDM
eukprot:1292860-Alexandrium_andersonii.AAC.1